jgi:hypothetical protein
MYGCTDRRTYVETVRRAGRQHKYRLTERKTDVQTASQTNRLSDRQTDVQIDRFLYMQKDVKKDRETNSDKLELINFKIKQFLLIKLRR